MPRVLFDGGSGRLRLDPEPFDALLSWAEGQTVDHPAHRALTEAGVVTGDRAHPAVAPAVEAIAEPACLLTLRVIPVGGEAGGTQGACWMGERAAALFLDAPDDLVELVCLAPMFVPAALARVLDISPHPGTPTEVVRLPGAQVHELFAAGVMPAAVAAVCGGAGARCWEVSARWPDPAGTAQTRTLRVVDTPTGLWTVTGTDTGSDDGTDSDDGTGSDDGPVTLRPVTPTAVWRLLLRRFPA